MIEQIQKFQNSGRVKRRELAEKQAAFDAAYAAATPEQQQQVDAYMQSTRNYSSANPATNSNARRYAADAYDIATKILNGEQVQGAGTPTDITSAYNVYSQFKAHNTKKAAAAPSSTESGGQKYYRYNWSKGLDSDWLSDDDTLEQRMGAFAQALRDNINSAKNSGRTVLGIDDAAMSNALALLNKETWTKDDMKTLRRAAQYAGVDAAAFKSYFGDLMPGQSAVDKNKKALSEAGYTLVDNMDFGDDRLNQLASQYHIAKKGNQYYLIDQDYSGPVKGKASVYMNTDWRDASKEGHGYIVGDNGELIFGDLNPYYKDKSSPYYNQIDTYLKELGNDQRWVGNNEKFNKYTSTSDSDLLNTFYDDLNGKSIADVSRYFDGNDVIVTSTGNNIGSMESTYGHLRLDDPNFTFYYRDKSGNLKKGNYQQITQDLGDITLDSDKKSKNLQDYRTLDYNLDGLSWQNERAIGDFDVNGRGEWHNFLTASRKMKNGWNNEVIESDSSMTGKGNGVQNNSGKFARLMLYAFANSKQLAASSDKNDQELSHTLDTWLQDHTNDLIYVIYNAIQAHPEDFQDPRYRKAFQQLLQSRKGVYSGTQKSTEVVQAEKHGGILKAAMGAGLDVNGNSIEPDTKESIAAKMRDEVNAKTRDENALKARANENGRTYTQQKAAEQSWSTSDTLRASALATDIVGLIGAITGAATGGVGSAVAVGSGFASMGIDAIADFNDDSVSTGQALKNLGINAGLAVGAAFGAKAPKIVKSVMKLVPKAMMAAGAAGIAFDPEVHNTIDRMSKGKTMNAGDWKNILTVLRTVTNIGTVGTMSHGAKKAVKKQNARIDEQVQKVKSQVSPDTTYLADADGKAVAVNKNVANDVSKLLKNNDKDGAIALLTKDASKGGGGLSQEVAESILSSSKSRGKNPFVKQFWKPEEHTYLREASNEQALSAIPEDVMAEAKLNALNEAKRDFNAAANRNWHTRLFNKMDHLTPFIKQQNYEVNAALGTTYKNEADLRKDLNSKISAVGAFEEGALNGAELKAAMDPTRVVNSRSLQRAQKRIDNLNKQIESSNKVIADLEKQSNALNISGQQGAIKAKRQQINDLKKNIEDLKKSVQASEEALLRAKNQFKKESTFKSANARYNKITAEYEAAKQAVDNYQNSPDPNIRALFQVDASGKLTNQLTPMAANDKKYAYIVDAVNRLSKAEAAYSKLAGPKSSIGKYKSAQSLFDEANDNYNKQVQELDKLMNEIRSLGKQFNIDKSANNLLKQQITSEKANQQPVLSAAERAREKKVATEEKNREGFRNEWVNQLSQVGESAGATRRTITLTDTASNNVMIKKGTKVTSYLHIRNKNLAAKVAKQKYPNGIELSAEQAGKLVNSQQKSAVNGAIYDATSNELVLFEHGGNLTSKYSHLRK